MESNNINIKIFDTLYELSLEELRAYAGSQEMVANYEQMAAFVYSRYFLFCATGSQDALMAVAYHVRLWIFSYPSDHAGHLCRQSAVRKTLEVLTKLVKQRPNPKCLRHRIEPERPREVYRATQLDSDIKGSLVQWKDFISTAYTVLDIVQQLCARDERFTFIETALEEVIKDTETRRIGNRQRRSSMQPLVNELSHLLMREPCETWSQEDIAKIMPVYHLLFTDPIRNSKTNNGRFPKLKFRPLPTDALRDIINSLIYEILLVFDFDLLQAPTRIDKPLECGTPNPDLGLLQRVYSKSQDLELVLKGYGQYQPGTSKPEEIDSHICTYIYSSNLECYTGRVRVLQILAGVGKAPLDCRLIECDLYKDGIPEALSYVWGSKTTPGTTILVDGKLFHVTTRLYNILRQLRRADAPRTVWVDAICINQENLDEKVHQVRLIGDIFARAKNTIIWLDDSAARPDINRITDIYGKPFPKGFGGVTVDENDLSAIVDAYYKCPDRKHAGTKAIMLCIMLTNTLCRIMSNEWWERVWTLQEAILPRKAPIFHFKGHCFSLDTFTAARDIIYWNAGQSEVVKYSKIPLQERIEWIQDDAVREQLKLALPERISEARNVEPLACSMRRSRRKAGGVRDTTLWSLLRSMRALRATIPSDKVFALASLLPKSLGLLIKVDYHEDGREWVFRRITARAYNSEGFALIKYYPFLGESQNPSNKIPNAPSWVFDLNTTTTRGSYSSRSMISQETLDGYLFSASIDIDEPPNVCRGDFLRFATPLTLFCGGRCIDGIAITGSIPILDKRDMDKSLATFLSMIYATAVPLQENVSSQQAQKNDMVILERLFCLMHKSVYMSYLDRKTLIEVRNSYLAGKPYFVTSNGIVGITTAPIEAGDILAWIHDAPVYFVLREVEEEEEKGESITRRHKIVARAVIAQNLYNTKALIDKALDQRLRII